MQTTQQSALHTQAHQENILVLKRSALFSNHEIWQGLQTLPMATFLDLIGKHQEFLPRYQMEIDPSYKQIIPYLVFKHKDTYFLMQRTNNSTETRLHNKYSLGIGGHIRQEDMGSNSIIDWAEREFHEEVDYKGKLSVSSLGILNDDSDAVGQVHIGFVFLLEGDSDAISVHSELKSGQLLSLDQLEEYYPHMESWSQMVFMALRNR